MGQLCSRYSWPEMRLPYSAATGIYSQAALPRLPTYHRTPNWRICLFVWRGWSLQASLNSHEIRIISKSMSFPAFGVSIAVRSFRPFSQPHTRNRGLRPSFKPSLYRLHFWASFFFLGFIVFIYQIEMMISPYHLSKLSQ